MKELAVLLVISFFALSLAEQNEGKDQIDLIAEDEKVEENKIEVDYIQDPCSKVHCGTGRVCEAEESKNTKCICVKSCPPENDERRKVCSNHNETWDSDCEVYRMRCLCDEKSIECKHKKYKHVHVDYYGSCRDIPSCTDEQKEDFPRRMREWLFNIMKDLAQRRELGEEYMQLEQEAETSLARKWVNAVIWKFCDLDAHPHDRTVSRHELFPIRAPLLSMEHCIAPFLDSCDGDDDHNITLKEWGLCLGLDEGEIEDKCSSIRGNHQD